MIIAVIDEAFAVAKKKPEKPENSGMYGIQIHDLCNMGAAKVASITKMIIFHFILHPAVLIIYDFSLYS